MQRVLLSLGIFDPEHDVACAGIGPPKQMLLDPAHDEQMIPGAGNQ